MKNSRDCLQAENEDLGQAPMDLQAILVLHSKHNIHVLRMQRLNTKFWFFSLCTE